MSGQVYLYLQYQFANRLIPHYVIRVVRRKGCVSYRTDRSAIASIHLVPRQPARLALVDLARPGALAVRGPRGACRILATRVVSGVEALGASRRQKR